MILTRLRVVALVMVFASCAMDPADSADPDPADSTSESSEGLTLAQPVYVQYHLWFAKEEALPGGYPWYGWREVSAAVPSPVDPTKLWTPWRRKIISKVGLPLVGPYASNNNPALVKYHFELAKAAGIGGMFGSVYHGDWIPIFQQHQNVASQVGIPLAGELYHGVFPSGTQSDQIGWMTWFLGATKGHASYLRIGGQPAVWIANYPVNGVYPWGNVAGLTQILNAVQQRIGETPYVIMTGPVRDSSGAAFASIPQVGRVVTDESIILFWNLYGVTGSNGVTPSASQYEAQYQTQIASSMAQAPGKYGLHIYPGFDERGYFPRTQPRGGAGLVSRQVIGRDGNGMYAANDGFLAAGLERARVNNVPVFIESWNDWNENTQIEPGLATNGFAIHQDPYSALRRIAAIKGITSPVFNAPSTQLMDPPLVTYCRYKQLPQYGGRRVLLHGKLGLGQGANLSDGITFAVMYYDEDRQVGVWRAAALVSKRYDGTLKSFSVDITPFLDKSAIAIGIEAGPNASYDWAYLAELKVSWYGTEVDLLRDSVLRSFFWNSAAGPITWGSATTPSNGVAWLAANPTLEDGLVHSDSAYLHPNWQANGFMHGTVNFDGFAPDLARCGQ